MFQNSLRTTARFRDARRGSGLYFACDSAQVPISGVSQTSNVTLLNLLLFLLPDFVPYCGHSFSEERRNTSASEVGAGSSGNHNGHEDHPPGCRRGGCRCPSRRPRLEIRRPLGADRHWSQSQVSPCTSECAFAVIILTDFDGCSLRGGGPLSLEQAQMVTTGLNCVQVDLISAVARARHVLCCAFVHTRSWERALLPHVEECCIVF